MWLYLKTHLVLPHGTPFENHCTNTMSERHDKLRIQADMEWSEIQAGQNAEVVTD